MDIIQIYVDKRECVFCVFCGLPATVLSGCSVDYLLPFRPVVLGNCVCLLFWALELLFIFIPFSSLCFAFVLSPRTAVYSPHYSSQCLLRERIADFAHTYAYHTCTWQHPPYSFNSIAMYCNDQFLRPFLLYPLIETDNKATTPEAFKDCEIVALCTSVLLSGFKHLKAIARCGN